MSMMIKSNTEKLDREAALEELKKEQSQKVQREKSGEAKKTLYAGDTALAKEDTVLNKKIKAQKEALKELLDQHAMEMKLDDSMERMEVRRDELAETAGKAVEEQKKVQEMRKAYQAEYGVTEDTPEELLPQDEAYVTAMEQFDEMEEVWTDEATSAQEGKKTLGKAMSDMQIERAKTHPMVDAATNAEEIMESASEEIIGMLRQEAVDHLDEKIQEIVEEAEKKAEEEQEEEEKLEKIKDEKDQIVVTKKKKPIKAPEIDLDDIQKAAKKIIREEALLEEDIKGIAVDELT